MLGIQMRSSVWACSVDNGRDGGSAITMVRNRKRPVLWVTAVGVLLLCVLASPAMATDYTWVASGEPLEASGNWNDASHWLPLGGPPGAGDTATINLVWAETYTVTLNANVTVDGFTLDSDDAEFYASSRTFTVDGPSQLSAGSVWWHNSTWTGTGTITNDTDMTIRGLSTISSTFIQNGNVLVQGGGGTSSARLTTATGFTNAGTITLESVDSGHYSDLTVTAGTLINDGVINVNEGSSGGRTIAADLVNDGTVNLNTVAIFSKASGVYTNNADFNIASAGTLTISGNSQTFTQAAGTLAVDGTFKMSSSTTFNFDGGTITGTSILDDSTLNIGASSAGAAFFTMRGYSMLSGNIAADQTIWVRGGSVTSSARLTAATGFTNSGTIILESTDSGYSSDLTVTAGTLTNDGVIDVNEGSSGARTIAADLANDGTVNLNTATTFSRTDGVYTNNSAFNIASAGTLTISGNSQTFIQAGGTLAVDGAFNMSGATFDFNGGTITGPPILDDSALNIGVGSTGAAFFTMRGYSVLSGDIAVDQTIWVRGGSGTSSARLTAATGFTNSGTIRIESTDSGYSSDLTVTAGTLTNDGVINVNEGSSGARTISADLDNNNEVNLNTSTTFSKANGVYTNNADFNIASDASLSISGSSQTFTQAGGTLAIDGTFKMSNNTTFNFLNTGVITGTPILDDSTLNIGVGSIGSAFFTMRGYSTLSGDIAVSQTVWVQGSAAGGTAHLTAATGFTNSGTIRIESTDAGYSSGLTVTEGTLTNDGVIDVNKGSSGARTISADLANDGTVNLNTAVTFSKASGAYTNNAYFNIDSGGSLSVSGSSQTFTQAGGTLAISGAFNMSNNTTFNFNGGMITAPPILDDSTLNIGVGSIGSAFFTMRGYSTLSGDIAVSQTVWVQGNSVGGHATLTAAEGFTNSGTITLESLVAGYTSNLTVTTGTLTNAATGVIDINEGSAGTRTLSLELANYGEIAFEKSATLGRAGAAHVNYGDFVTTTDGVVVSLTGDTFTNDATGTLKLALGGVDQYILNVSGTANLAGTLDLSVIDCEHPYIGQTFDVLTATTAMSGTFDAVTGLESYDAIYDNGPPGTVIVEVTGVPVPGDLNGDTFVDMLDVPLFVETLLDPLDEYTHLCYLADIDGSGSTNGLDIQPFLLLLMP